MADTFNWNDLDDGERVVETVRAVAVYHNEQGKIVVRQERDWNEEEDSFIVLPVEAAEILIQKLRALIDGQS